MKEINTRSLNMLPVQRNGYTDHMNIRGGHLISCEIAAATGIVLEVLPDEIKRGNSDEVHLGKLSFQ